MKALFAPSLMCMDLTDVRTQIEIMDKYADMYHVDIMDGHFVKNISLSPAFVEQVRKCTKLPIDVHLMVEHPNDFIEVLANAGANMITVQVETINKDAFRTLDKIHGLGCEVGLIFNPATPLETAMHYLGRVEKVTILTVDAGFAGQKFIPEMLEKVRAAKVLKEEEGYKYTVEVDGSCNRDTIQLLKNAGCEQFIVGYSGLFCSGDNLEGAFIKMKEDF